MLNYTLSKLSIGSYKDKGSNFLAVAKPISDFDDVKSKLINIKDRYPDASHICYAYRIKSGQNIDEYSSDSGEPKGSAGLPILNTLKRNNLINVIIFVVRYFGGIKLGIPGLIQAYEAAATDAIDNVKLKKWIEKKQLEFTYPYRLDGMIESLLKQYHIVVLHKDFGVKIHIQLEIELKTIKAFIESIKNLSSDSTKIIIKE